MDYDKAFDKIVKSVDNFTEAVAREVDLRNLNYLLKDKALEMGFCIKVKSASFSTVYLNDDGSLMIRFKTENDSVLDYFLSELTTMASLQVGLVCKRVLEMKKIYDVSFSVPEKSLSGTINVEAFDCTHAKELAENELFEFFEYNFAILGVKSK